MATVWRCSASSLDAHDGTPAHDDWRLGCRSVGLEEAVAHGGRRSLLVGVAFVVVAGSVGGAWAVFRSSHGNPDPGGHILTALKSVERAVPAGAQVSLRQASEPGWDSCDGRSGTFGWDDITVGVQFFTSVSPTVLVANTDKTLRAIGWQRTRTLNSPLGPGATWSRTVAGSTPATATLAPGTRGGGTGVYWDLDAVAPPQGQHVSGC